MKSIKTLSGNEKPFAVMMWCRRLLTSGCTQKEFADVFGKDLAETFSTIATSRDCNRKVCDEFCKSIALVKPNIHDLAYIVYDKFMDFSDELQIVASDAKLLSRYFDLEVGMTYIEFSDYLYSLPEDNVLTDEAFDKIVKKLGLTNVRKIIYYDLANAACNLQQAAYNVALGYTYANCVSITGQQATFSDVQNLIKQTFNCAYKALYYYGYKNDLHDTIGLMLNAWCVNRNIDPGSVLSRSLVKILREEQLTELELNTQALGVYDALIGVLRRVGDDIILTVKAKLPQYKGKYMSDITLLENHWTEL